MLGSSSSSVSALTTTGSAFAAVLQRALEHRQRLIRGGGGLSVHRWRVRSRVGAAIEVAVEARSLARVTGRADGLNQGYQRVAIAVVPDLANALQVARSPALVPELVPRAAVEVDLPGLAGAAQRLVVHVSKRKHLTGVPVLHHAGHQPVFVEMDRLR